MSLTLQGGNLPDQKYPEIRLLGEQEINSYCVKCWISGSVCCSSKFNPNLHKNIFFLSYLFMRSFPLSFKKCPSRTDPCLPSVSILVRKTEEIHSQPSSLETFSQLIAIHYSLAFVVQSLSCIQIFATPGTTAHQAFLSFTISWSLLKLMSIESVMPPNHLILDRVF